MSESKAPPQGMPNLGVPLVNADRTVGFAWYKLFTSLFNAVLAGPPATGNPGTPGTSPGTIWETYQDLEKEIDNRANGDANLQNQIDALRQRIVLLENKP